jgi:hypothetical protein
MLLVLWSLTAAEFLNKNLFPLLQLDSLSRATRTGLENFRCHMQTCFGLLMMGLEGIDG